MGQPKIEINFGGIFFRVASDMKFYHPEGKLGEIVCFFLCFFSNSVFQICLNNQGTGVKKNNSHKGVANLVNTKICKKPEK